MAWRFLILITLCCLAIGAHARGESSDTEPVAAVQTTAKKWYDRFNLRGYAQLRYNRLGATNPNLVNDQGDKSIGDRNSLFLRRARLILSGDIGDHVYIYIQPDFASTPVNGTLHFAQIRDFYVDVAIDHAKEFRFRLGQSKVPFGFENMQSSSNRLPLDRSDGVNSAVRDERELGVYFYWAPAEIRKRFKFLVDSGLKGAGDYGVFALGVFNGQTANRPEMNNDMHAVTRLTYPFEIFEGQFLELSAQAYTGFYRPAKDPGVGGADDFLDRRLGGTFILYPAPIGLGVEYLVGEGPQLNDAGTEIGRSTLEGGYALISFKWRSVIPFARWNFYRGPRKHETNSPKNQTYETEFGIEWQIIPELELTAEYSLADRTSSAKPYKNEYGRFARFQVQWNY